MAEAAAWSPLIGGGHWADSELQALGLGDSQDPTSRNSTSTNSSATPTAAPPTADAGNATAEPPFVIQPDGSGVGERRLATWISPAYLCAVQRRSM